MTTNDEAFRRPLSRTVPNALRPPVVSHTTGDRHLERFASDLWRATMLAAVCQAPLDATDASLTLAQLGRFR